MEPVIFRAVRPVFDLGIAIGDRVVFDPNGPALFTRYRPVPIPNPGRVLLEVESGALEPVTLTTPPPSVDEIRQVVGAAPSLPRSLRLRGPFRRRYLQVVK